MIPRLIRFGKGWLLFTRHKTVFIGEKPPPHSHPCPGCGSKTWHAAHECPGPHCPICGPGCTGWPHRGGPRIWTLDGDHPTWGHCSLDDPELIASMAAENARRALIRDINQMDPVFRHIQRPTSTPRSRTARLLRSIARLMHIRA